MESFLTASKTALADLFSYEKIRVVTGNESCDLDSAVCALLQGLLEYLDIERKNERSIAVIPLLNIPKREFRVKTEVVFHFKRHDIPLHLLTFRDQIDLHDLFSRNKLELILVDHHVFSKKEDESLISSVIAAFDHRPRDASSPWQGDQVLHLERVGSCATLITRNLLKKQPEILDARLASFLRGPILIDTANFSEVICRTTALDIEIGKVLETLASPTFDKGDDAYREILAAKTDLTDLTADDLIVKDLKICNGIPIVGLPILVEEFIVSKNGLPATKEFARNRGSTSLIVLIGMNLNNEHMSRDIALLSLDAADERVEQIIGALTSATQPSLEMQLSRTIENDVNGWSKLLLFNQGNLRASRKDILPILQRTIPILP